eukprot:scaffold2012_cov181-Chaetoceros_neogracile.AAC.3
MPTIKGTASIASNAAQNKLLRSTKFPTSFATPVDLTKVNTAVVSQWIEKKIETLLGFEDEIVASMAINLFFPKLNDDSSGGAASDVKYSKVDPRKAQLDLVGFLGEEESANFASLLWDMLLDAQSQPRGIPTKLIEEKKKELSTQSHGPNSGTLKSSTSAPNSRPRELRHEQPYPRAQHTEQSHMRFDVGRSDPRQDRGRRGEPDGYRYANPNNREDFDRRNHRDWDDRDRGDRDRGDHRRNDTYRTDRRSEDSYGRKRNGSSDRRSTGRNNHISRSSRNQDRRLRRSRSRSRSRSRDRYSSRRSRSDSSDRRYHSHPRRDSRRNGGRSDDRERYRSRRSLSSSRSRSEQRSRSRSRSPSRERSRSQNVRGRNHSISSHDSRDRRSPSPRRRNHSSSHD